MSDNPGVVEHNIGPDWKLQALLNLLFHLLLFILFHTEYQNIYLCFKSANPFTMKF